MTRTLISRRTVLRGVGAAVALPWLEAMTPLSALASAPAAKSIPTRMAFLYVPNGKNMPDWTPKAEGSVFELPAILKPLEPVKDDLLVLTGLTADKARPNGDGPGDHARALAAFLTGCQPRKTDGVDIRAGISVDQVAAARLADQTRLPSLEIGCEGGRQAGNCDSGYSCVYSSTISWRSATTPVPKEINPRLVFERLFGSGPDAERARRDATRRSILDFVREDAGGLRRQLGAGDRRKLDEYFSSLRDIEQRIDRAARLPEVKAPDYARPAGVPKEFEEHLRLMCDLLVLAFQTDVTRVATFVLANEGSNRPYRFIGVPEGHHDLSHHGNDPKKRAKIREINRFHVSQLAYLLKGLKAVKEGDGTLLDHCMIAYGSGNSDGNRHNHDDLPVLLAGKGGGTIKTGRHLRYPRNTPLNNLWLAMLDRVSVKVPNLGDATGRLPGLEG
jgi:hypothetical protein